MHDWHVTVLHEQIGAGVNAQVQYNPKAKSACFRLSISSEGDFGFVTDPERLALHEVLHLMLGDFCYTTANLGSDTHDLVVAREHEVINKLMRVL